MNTIDNCKLCGQPKAPKGGSFTQWVFACRCDDAVDQDLPNTCAACGKLIEQGKTGSFTQWVLQSNQCVCEDPIPVLADGTVGKTERKSTVSELTKHSFPIERYKPLDWLGGGGAGAVYLSFDKHLRKQVAVKVLNSVTEGQLAEFQSEARVTARFKHPNVVSIIDFGLTEARAPYMVLEHVDGQPLSTLIEQPDSLTTAETLDLFIQIASALAKAHESGIYHRDVKSSNVLVSTQEHGIRKAQIIDFGIAVTQNASSELSDVSGKQLIGTPKYMSPDQYLGGEFDARSEVYSLGCLMYEVLTGRVPFVAESAIAILEQHANAPVPTFIKVGADLAGTQVENVVRKCLEKQARDRFQTMEELRGALVSAVSELGVIEQRRFDEQGLYDEHDDRLSIDQSNLGGERKSNRMLIPAVLIGCLLVTGGLGYGVKTVLFDESRTEQTKPVKKKKQNPKPLETVIVTAEEKEYEKLTKKIKKDPNDWFLYYSRAHMLGALDRREEELSDFNKAISLKPTDGELYEGRGEVKLILEKREEAIKDFDLSIKNKSKHASRVYRFKGTALAALGRNKEAEESLTKSIELSPDNYSAWFSRGQIYFQTGRYEKALTDYSRCLEIKPKDVRALNRRADTYEKLGKNDLAKLDRNGIGKDYGNLLLGIQDATSNMRTMVEKSEGVSRNSEKVSGSKQPR